MPPDERQDEICSVMRDMSDLLTIEADLGLSALAAVQAGSLDRLAHFSEELLTCHVQYAAKYRRLMGLWLRPSTFAEPPPGAGRNLSHLKARHGGRRSGSDRGPEK
jgi:hypothetical protein